MLSILLPRHQDMRKLGATHGAIQDVGLGSGAVAAGRDATVAVINHWTRKFWDEGKQLEARFEEFIANQVQT